MKHRELYDMVVTYEDILSDPEGACRRLLEVCRIPERHLPAAMGAFETDSQNGTFGERGGSKYKRLSRRGRTEMGLRSLSILLFCRLVRRQHGKWNSVSQVYM